MRKMIMTLIILATAYTCGVAQDMLKVGEFRNGKVIITNPDGLRGYFMNSLEKSGSLGKDLQVDAAPENDRFYVYYTVTGNKYRVHTIGILLIRMKNDVFIVANPPESEAGGPGAGGSFEVQCFGSCPACLPVIKWLSGNWLPVVYCSCPDNFEGECSMISKVIIQIKIGL
jgi:hypothetical protein